MASTFLIRHAQASFGTSNYDRLSPLGFRQAAIAGGFLAATAGRVARIVTGPLTRQFDTATVIAAKLREAHGEAPQVEVDPRLDELRIDEHIARLAPNLVDTTGEIATHLANMKSCSRSYQKVIQHVFVHWQQMAHDYEAETWREFIGRARLVLSDITERTPHGEGTIAVSSGALIAAITRAVLGVPDGSTYELFEVMKNCSITHLLHSNSRTSLSSFNDTSYLAAIGVKCGEASLITYR